MAGLDLTSPVTGGAQTGFTSPTYPLVTDTAPSNNGKQSAVSGTLGGTQVGVTTHSASSPFTITRFRPQQLKTLPAANPVTGVIKNIPNNVYKVITRKGVIPASGIPAIPMAITTSIPVPAGADTFDAANVRAAISAHVGALNQLSAALGDACVSGII
jgi:hypothetical protein